MIFFSYEIVTDGKKFRYKRNASLFEVLETGWRDGLARHFVHLRPERAVRPRTIGWAGIEEELFRVRFGFDVAGDRRNEQGEPKAIRTLLESLLDIAVAGSTGISAIDMRAEVPAPTLAMKSVERAGFGRLVPANRAVKITSYISNVYPIFRRS